MRNLKRLPNSRREAPGLEWAILKRLPATLAGGTLVPLLVSIGNRLYPREGSATELAKHLKTVDILSLATVATVWTAALTIAIGCVVVIIMKGSAYVADAYDPIDTEHPPSD